MDGRKAPRKGMTYVDANPGRLVTIEDDVLDIKRRIEERWPEIEVYFDKENFSAGKPAFLITEKCRDGVERLVCALATHNEDVLRTLEKADTYVAGQEDFNAINEAYNTAVEKENERKFEEQIGEAGERFMHALGKDGLRVNPISFYRSPSAAQ